MRKTILPQFIALLLGICLLGRAAALIAVPNPQLYSPRLPARIVAEVQATVAKGVRQAGFEVLENTSLSDSYLTSIQGLTKDGQQAFLQQRGIAGVLSTQLQRNLGGFVLHVEAIGCQPSLGFPKDAFSIQIGQYQNLPRCADELAAMLSAASAPADAGMTALLAPRILAPGSPMFLGHYLGSRMESALLARGYRLCTEASLNQALRINHLSGAFELTPGRCESLARELKVQNFIQITVNEYQVWSTGNLLQAKISGTLREISARHGELLQSSPFDFQLDSNDGRLAAFPPQSLSDTTAFGQAAIDLLVQEQLLRPWPRR